MPDLVFVSFSTLPHSAAMDELQRVYTECGFQYGTQKFHAFEEALTLNPWYYCLSAIAALFVPESGQCEYVLHVGSDGCVGTTFDTFLQAWNCTRDTKLAGFDVKRLLSFVQTELATASDSFVQVMPHGFYTSVSAVDVRTLVSGGPSRHDPAPELWRSRLKLKALRVATPRAYDDRASIAVDAVQSKLFDAIGIYARFNRTAHAPKLLDNALQYLTTTLSPTYVVV